MGETQDAAGARALDVRLFNSGAIRAHRGDAPSKARWLDASSREAPAMPPGAVIVLFTEGVRGDKAKRQVVLTGPKSAGEVLDAILATEHAARRDEAARCDEAATACRFCAQAAGDSACTARCREGFCGIMLAGGHWAGSLEGSRFMHVVHWSAPFCPVSRLAANGENVDAPGSAFFTVERSVVR
jgi:hypothetical protein